MVIAPANTGKDSSNKKAVMRIDHTKSGMRWKPIPGARILKIVVIKFMAPKIELIPDKCKLKIAQSTAPPEWAVMALKGG